ncbi:2-amino-4-hydroxy-6-hydroxymethyldihydropteridine diphosphokinase [Loigolactobacillus iwatensis]|uniref:2-amino-4-hydroxy-6- hydroxymethyldihydropteridine diphosphokinase n=1 Tax=Loigolactobacillus iwatensis TaxID=1267156 RepID=UPI001CDC03F9|nr:2-amino-4-hydroxy-6-hydroxymethyldihydropteridine diphosphokinase [Loigolactobacillus iwatensis]
MMYDVYLSLGANLGDRRLALETAINALKNVPEINVQQISSLYQTAPVGGVKQDDFYNCALYLRTSLTPTDLLVKLHQIEAAGKRQRKIHWGPRTIDLDILVYDDLKIQTKSLTIPHSQMHRRSFVLVPLLEITTGKLHKQTLILLQRLGDQQRIEKIGSVFNEADRVEKN